MIQIREAFSGFLLSTGPDVPTLIISIITAAVSMSLLTRLISGSSAEQIVGASQSNPPPLLPYWIPYYGHYIPFVYSADSVLKHARYTSMYQVQN
jgi:hypothetical protein